MYLGIDVGTSGVKVILTNDGNNIIAGDSENNLIIFSKNKSFNPLKIEINTNLQEGDKLELVQVLGWTN